MAAKTSLGERKSKAADAVAEAEWTWQEESYCRNVTREVRYAWRIEAHETVTLGRSVYTGIELMAYASAVCERCPVQWDCARFAIQVQATIGTWGGVEPVELRKAVRKTPNLISLAEDAGVPIQVAVRLHPT
jgi:hypothetical protein